MASTLLASRHSSVTGGPIQACKISSSSRGDRNACAWRVRSSLGDGEACRLARVESAPLGFARGLGLGLGLGRRAVDDRNGAIHSFSFRQEGSSSQHEEQESRRISIPLLGELPFDVPEVGEITPKKLAIWAVLATVAYVILDLIASRTVFNPKLWTYGSWLLVVWPLPAALVLGIATLVTAYKVKWRKPKEWEQMLMLVGSLVWLMLVPLAHVHGFVDGWPLLLFLVYTAFFLISAMVRYRLYGDLAPKSEDKQWEHRTSPSWQIGYVASLAAGHWLAAYEAPFLATSWNFGWQTKLAVGVLAAAMYTQYHASYFLGKYFVRLVRPRAVVMFGPYRWVRHPIYASYMLLFMGYCLALRSYKSMALILAVCIAYYEQRTRIEEEQLVDEFGPLYTGYVERVQNKYFPFLY